MKTRSNSTRPAKHLSQFVEAYLSRKHKIVSRGERTCFEGVLDTLYPGITYNDACEFLLVDLNDMKVGRVSDAHPKLERSVLEPLVASDPLKMQFLDLVLPK